jgi:hypothetical protein
MIKLIYFDIFYVEMWLPAVMQAVFAMDIEDGVLDDAPVNLWFEEYGYESK